MLFSLCEIATEIYITQNIEYIILKHKGCRLKHM